MMAGENWLNYLNAYNQWNPIWNEMPAGDDTDIDQLMKRLQADRMTRLDRGPDLSVPKDQRRTAKHTNLNTGESYEVDPETGRPVSGSAPSWANPATGQVLPRIGKETTASLPSYRYSDGLAPSQWITAESVQPQSPGWTPSVAEAMRNRLRNAGDWTDTGYDSQTVDTGDPGMPTVTVTTKRRPSLGSKIKDAYSGLEPSDIYNFPRWFASLFTAPEMPQQAFQGDTFKLTPEMQAYMEHVALGTALGAGAAGGPKPTIIDGWFNLGKGSKPQWYMPPEHPLNPTYAQAPINRPTALPPGQEPPLLLDRPILANEQAGVPALAPQINWTQGMRLPKIDLSYGPMKPQPLQIPQMLTKDPWQTTPRWQQNQDWIDAQRLAELILARLGNK